MSEQTMAEALRDGLREILAADERAIVLGEDVEAGGVFRITEGLLDEFGERRIFDTPLAESGFTGAAIGAALAGMRPIVEIQFVDFILPAVNQLISEAAKMRWRSRGEWQVPLVVRTPWGGGVHGGLYHSQSFEALFAHVPGLKVVAPATPADAKALLHAAVADPDPVIFLEHKRTYRLIRGEVPDPLPPVAIGEAALRRSGDDLTLISYGLMLHECLAAAETLAAEGIECHVLDLRTIAPLDQAALLDAARHTGKVVIVHEDHLSGGVGGEVAARIAEHAFDHLDGPITRVAGPDVPAMGYHPNLESAFMPDAERIAEAVRGLAAY
ncbi:MAG: alpha-ketoacid dehydrogenase subunit beta [Chloroflexota bacterium]|nr:alpha-ketoacid dehydrogenase subunit beta [Chloroflexota bacterium]